MDLRDALQPHHLVGLEPLPEATADPLRNEPHWSRKWLLRLMLFVGWVGAFYLVAWLKIIGPAVAARLWH